MVISVIPTPRMTLLSCLTQPAVKISKPNQRGIVRIGTVGIYTNQNSRVKHP